MISKAEHIGIMVRDIERSISFYKDILGLKLAEKRTNNGVQIALLEIGDIQIELVCGSKAPYQQSDGVVNHVAFTVSDIESALQHLRQHGVQLDTPEPVVIWDGLRVAFFRGPDGEKLELFERKPTQP